MYDDSHIKTATYKDKTNYTLVEFYTLYVRDVKVLEGRSPTCF